MLYVNSVDPRRAISTNSTGPVPLIKKCPEALPDRSKREDTTYLVMLPRSWLWGAVAGRQGNPASL